MAVACANRIYDFRLVRCHFLNLISIIEHPSISPKCNKYGILTFCENILHCIFYMFLTGVVPSLGLIDVTHRT